MKTITQLKEDRAKLIEDARKLYADADAPTAEDEARFDTMHADADKIGDQIKRLERQEAADAELKKLDDRVTRSAEHHEGVAEDSVTGTNSPEYRQGFEAYLRRGHKKMTANEHRALEVGTDSEGGYTVDDVLLARLIAIRDEFNVMRGLATVLQSGQDVKIPSEASLGVATWTAEEAAYTESDDAFGQVAFTSNKLGRIVKASEELLQDSVFPIGNYITSQIGRSIGLGEEAAFVAGDGSAKPTGVVNGSSLGVTAAGAAAITGDEIIDLYHSLARPYRGVATFMAADATIKLIRKLKDGNSQYLWQPGLQAGQPDSVLGRPLVTSDSVPAATTGLKSVVFGDMSAYYIIDRSPIAIQRLDELYAANGHVGFRGFARTDGKLTASAAVKHLIQA